MVPQPAKQGSTTLKTLIVPQPAEQGLPKLRRSNASGALWNKAFGTTLQRQRNTGWSLEIQRQPREPEPPLNDHPKKQVLEKLIVPQPAEQGPTSKFSMCMAEKGS